MPKDEAGLPHPVLSDRVPDARMLEQSSSLSSWAIQPPQWRHWRIAMWSVHTSFSCGRRIRAEKGMTLRANLAEVS